MRHGFLVTIKLAILIIALFIGINRVEAGYQKTKASGETIVDKADYRESAFTFAQDLRASSQITNTNPTFGLSVPLDTACSNIWSSYPQDGVPLWLSTPRTSDGLATQVDYNFLAGNLIKTGLVLANDCPANGLRVNGAANTCGLEKARPVVLNWQNQFDQTIWIASVTNAVPALLLKRILAAENQFWFGSSNDYIHFGSGQITQAGLDPLFITYPNFYAEVCRKVISSASCMKPFSQQSSTNQAMIRGYFLLHYVDASCANCPIGMDLYKAYNSIDIVAKLLVANCQQLNQVFYNITDYRAGRSSSYEDLWRINLANYNTGSGCIANAIKATYKEYSYIYWDDFIKHLSDNCSLTVDYVDHITQ